jgi:hypothetical protein
VYSAELDVYRIDCENQKGPDMMVSYHDNDHYNSVRDCRMSKPPTFTKVYYEPQQSSVEDNETEEELDNDGDEDDEYIFKDDADEAGDTDDTSDDTHPLDADETTTTDHVAGGTTIDIATPSKSAPCPCGSGKRYKKCCPAKQLKADQEEKRSAAVRRVASDEELELGGPMRVMVI